MQEVNIIPKIEGQQRILVAPLNWGLGHASRCIPVISELQAQGHTIIIAADGYPLQLLREEFPHLSYIEFPSFNIKYSSKSSQIGAMMLSLPRILCGIRNEHYQLKRLIKDLRLTMIISDNRFGLWSKQIPCVYITHQLMIKMPKGLACFENLLWRMHRSIINKYADCWIPDFEAEGGLSGDLAHKYILPKHARFIGGLSRFTNVHDAEESDPIDVLAVLSGPEPHRTLLEKELISKYKDSSLKVVIVQGQPVAEIKRTVINNIQILSHLPSAELKAYMMQAGEIICRSGYSSIMDLYVLKRKATLIPTPGQTEQEYLAEWNTKKGLSRLT